MIIYIHGYSGSGEGSKAKLFRNYYNSRGEKFIAPSLSYVPELAIKTLEELIVSCDNHDSVRLIGSSLGGFYAMYLASKYKLKAALINPAIYPDKTLGHKFGLIPNFYDNSSFLWNESHVKMLKKYELAHIDTSRFLLLVQKGDELLNYNDSVKKLDGCRQIIEEGGSHSFDNIEGHYKTITTFFSKESSLKELVEDYTKDPDYYNDNRAYEKDDRGRLSKFKEVLFNCIEMDFPYEIPFRIHCVNEDNLDLYIELVKFDFKEWPEYITKLDAI